VTTGPLGAKLRRALRLAGMRPLPNLPGRNSVDLRGKRILLTGASSGIGEVAAELLAGEGATVIAVARRAELLTALVERITARGGSAIAIPANLTDFGAIDELVKTVGRVDILINNAARSIRRPLAESLERWHDVERITQLNYYAPLRLIRGVAPGMIERGDGHIINVSTWRVLPEASPLFSCYNASKAALASVSRVIETEWAPL
jgi:NAD(P)-dependent dehydrogenase (short-subunit alcohol dehydrogenase family)